MKFISLFLRGRNKEEKKTIPFPGFRLSQFPRRERMAGDDADDRSSEPSLVLGERFVPGSDSQHFCMPTAVAVMPSGEVVIADGYCNDRIVVLDQEGRFITQLPPRGSDGRFIYEKIKVCRANGCG